MLHLVMMTSMNGGDRGGVDYPHLMMPSRRRSLAQEGEFAVSVRQKKSNAIKTMQK